jgi:hypothetical protein
MFVHFQITTLSGRKTGCRKIQGTGVTAPSRRNKNGFGAHNAPRLHRWGNFAPGTVAFRDSFAAMHFDSAPMYGSREGR